MATATLKRGANSTSKKSMRTSAGAGTAREDGLKLNNVSSATVAARTGKSWEQWLKALDAAGAKKLDHKGIVKIVGEQFGIGPWWRQMVTVGYEQARGLRQVNQKVDGYSFSVTRTLAVPMSALFAAWSDEPTRRRWIGEPMTIRKMTPNRSVRVGWPDGTNVEVMFYPQPSGSNRVSVQHNKLPSKAAMERMRAFWRQKLDAMAKVLA
jgi:hypothetical protein